MTITKKRQHNLQLPISRLPNEILSLIFCYLRNSYIRSARQRHRNRHGPQCLKDWVIVTHVCHVWREVALDTRLLWCHIDVLPPVRGWIPELLQRSKDSPLTVIIEWSSHQSSLDQVRLHFGRVRELVLECPTTITLQGVFLSSFQNLESLEISRSSARPFTLNDSHLRAECIRRLILRCCSIDWNSKFLQGLTHLRLVDVPDSCTLGCHDFTHVLSKIPALEILHLSRFLQEENVKTHQASKVHLQHLQRLSVNEALSGMAQFLPCLVVPRSCKLHICAHNEHDEVCDKFRVILSWVSKHFRVPTTSVACDHQPIRGLYLRQNQEPNVFFKVEGFCDVLSHEQLETAAPILTFAALWDCRRSSFSDLFSLLPLDSISFFGMATNFAVYSPEFWTGSLGSIQTLQTIYLNTETSNFWEALAPAKTDDRAVKSLSFSALTSVTVDDGLVDFQLILDTLRVRSELGGPQLRDLQFSYPPPTPIMTQLEELVSYIQVVGNGPDADDSFSEDDEF